jgi:hypothetical protein
MIGSTVSAVTIEDGALSDNYLKISLARPHEANRIVDVLIGGLTADGLHEAQHADGAYVRLSRSSITTADSTGSE